MLIGDISAGNVSNKYMSHHDLFMLPYIEIIVNNNLSIYIVDNNLSIYIVD